MDAKVNGQVPRFNSDIVSKAINAFVDTADAEVSFLVNQLFDTWIDSGSWAPVQLCEMERNRTAICELLDQIEAAKLRPIDKVDPQCRYSVSVITSEGKQEQILIAATSKREARQQARAEHKPCRVLSAVQLVDSDQQQWNQFYATLPIDAFRSEPVQPADHITNQQLLNNIGEFLDVSDPYETTGQIQYLYKLFNEQPDHILHDDPETMYSIGRNVQALVWLIEDFRNYEYVGWTWRKELNQPKQAAEVRAFLTRFIDNSDEHAGNWIEYLFTEYLLTDECDQASREDRYQLRVNSNAASELCRQLYAYHKAAEL